MKVTLLDVTGYECDLPPAPRGRSMGPENKKELAEKPETGLSPGSVPAVYCLWEAVMTIFRPFSISSTL